MKSNGNANPQLNIVADENIPGLETWFGNLGAITRIPGRTMSQTQLKDADVLLVRSVTEVNQSLLEGTPVRFVGSCTIGTDHLDTAWLEAQGIAWSAAPGCNANSVVEYVFCALAALNVDWRGRSFGIVGCGNVGGLLQKKLHALQVPCKVYDPWLTENPDSSDLKSVLQQDIVCLHAPLVKDGPHPSLHMIDTAALAAIRPGTVLISAGRGAVIDNAALLERLRGKPDITTVLDVWENEPDIRTDLLAKVDLGSPHIAGYSHDGKLAGTRMIRDALNRVLGWPEVAQPGTDAKTKLPVVSEQSGFAAIRELLLNIYDPREDDRRLRDAAAGEQPMVRSFDLLRKHYPQRLELSHFKVQAPGLDDAARKQLAILGLN
ncbi:4-phosphoerythronate dehydrogenase [Microbulbifer harenosus]|uniref:Erythronate-4-phosphate dehydrogenase n=1 Tax=Microbulbifer harenosus TaxID=2576840 RepID=A0ABY2UIK6_9GAMM|nr:4-phosphoerythronate dehydrogenase [Microbulbifer harenosus]TLM77575.1 4-phosphoerythronate dehydrogenase [Microbulbifer harenosus]